MKQAKATQATPSETSASPAMAVARIESGAVGTALTLDQLHQRLEFIRQAMANEMTEGQDYGKIPGTGDKPTLLQPGAQKLLLLFQMREQVKKEVLREFQSLPLHREYEFTVTVFPAGAKAEDGWDGVGTCSTLESKYRYRKTGRKCPNCGHEGTIIPENPKYLKPGQIAGWLCWSKKGGCGAKFAQGDTAIVSQGDSKSENADPADCWNTCRKMAFKRALVAAAINATNTSDLWTQDLEEMGNGSMEPAGNAPGRSGGVSTATVIEKSSPGPNGARGTPEEEGDFESASVEKPTKQSVPAKENSPADKPQKPSQICENPEIQCAASPDIAAAVLRNLSKGFESRFLDEFAQKAGVLLAAESWNDLPLRWYPANKGQLDALKLALVKFGEGEPDPKWPFPANRESEPAVKKKPIEVPRDPKPATAGTASADAKAQSWYGFIVPVPRRGERRTDYLKNPDTIGGLYEDRHESEYARKRLFGFANHFEAKGWTKNDSTAMPASDADKKFRLELDSFLNWYKRTHPDEKL